MNTYSVRMKQVVEQFNLTVLHASTDYETVEIMVEEVSRPGLQLAGFFNHFEPLRLQVIGNVESAYISELSHERLLEVFSEMFSKKIPALIFARNIEPTPECLEMAKKYDVTVLRCLESTSYIVSSLITYLKSALAPRITRHGVLVEVYGEGLLLIGDSGIGKSETALELIKRGHRLIADDAVEVKRISRDTLVGCAPELIRYYMELRGIGVINVRHLYGMGAVKPETNIDLVVSMEPWEDGKAYDRLGLTNETASFLGVSLPQVTIPVRPGRNLAVIMELAAMNNRQKKMGYNAAEALTAEHDRAIDLGLL